MSKIYMITVGLIATLVLTGCPEPKPITTVNFSIMGADTAKVNQVVGMRAVALIPDVDFYWELTKTVKGSHPKVVEKKLEREAKNASAMILEFKADKPGKYVMTIQAFRTGLTETKKSHTFTVTK